MIHTNCYGYWVVFPHTNVSLMLHNNSKVSQGSSVGEALPAICLHLLGITGISQINKPEDGLSEYRLGSGCELQYDWMLLW